ncbi:MAG: hypothetical protein K2M91_10145 [Lachnospiraceae bacterium]|nr:hypothetical protein [Lachnospiraceae bacterium]
MSFKTFFWIEDRKGGASYTFWENFMKYLCPEVIVESKKNNSELVKAVRTLKDADNKYVIVYDNSFDNLQIAMELKLLKHYVDEKDNVALIDIICFEYTLLEFKDLIKWIYAPEDEFLEKRANIIVAREKLVNSIDSGDLKYKDIQEIVEYDQHLQEHNVEQLAARLLFDLTKNTGFEVSKGTIGDCWIKSCCEWEKREANDICGLDNGRLAIVDKMRSIYKGTSLKEQFSKAGLEVSF